MLFEAGRLTPARVWRGVALLLACGIFAVDSFTKVEASISILYLTVLVMVAQGGTAKEVRRAVIGTGVLALGSWGIAHGPAPTMDSLFRLVFVEVAICLTGALLTSRLALRDVRNALEQSRKDLLQRVEERTAELTRSQERFAALWEVSNITFAEQDFSRVIPVLERLKREGVTDLSSYFSSHPDVLRECIDLVQTVSVNPATARLLGYDSMEELAAQPTARHSDEIDAVMLRQLELPFYGRPATEGRTTLIGKDGRQVPIFYTVHHMPDDHQLSSLVDLTEQQRAEEMRLVAQEELARAGRLATIGAFSISVAHELNQPITSLMIDARSALNMASAEEPVIDGLKSTLQRVGRNAERVAGIVSSIRENISGRERPLAVVDLCRLAHDTADLLARDLRQARAVLKVACDADVPQVFGDAVDLQQVLVNLILNASESMADWNGERSIRVDVTRLPDAVRVSVADSGRGIEPGMLDKLFEPFFTTKPKGIGMGLVICRSAVQRFGGDLQARNRNSSGAEFFFTLPAIEKASVAA